MQYERLRHLELPSGSILREFFEGIPMMSLRRLVTLAATFTLIVAQLVSVGGGAQASDQKTFLAWANAGYSGTAGTDFAVGYSAISASRIGNSQNTRQWLSGAQSRGGFLSEPTDMVMDSAKGWVYWIDDYGVERASVGGCAITQRCNVNLYGTFELTGHLPEYEYVTGLTLDSTRNYLYVGIYNLNLRTYQIVKLKADGSSVPSDASVLSSAQSIAGRSGIGSIVEFEGKLYFTVDGAGTTDSISWASLTSSAHGDLAISDSVVNRPWGLAVDVKNRALYWANWESGGDPAGSISKWDFGTGLASDLYTASTCPSSLRGPAGVAVDSSTGKIYWGNFNGGDPGAGNVSGSACSPVDTSGAPNRQQASVALIKSPTLKSAPAVTFTKRKHAILSCTTGTWLADVEASRLYQAPQTSKFVFSWKRNGKPVAGVASKLRANKSGSYTCSVKASNYAGSVTANSAAIKVTAEQAK